MTGAALAVAGLHAGYGQGTVLQDIGFEVAAGEVCAILGPNGAGKTTLLRALSGMVRVRGAVRLDGTDVAGRAPEALARLGVAHVPEGRGTFAPLTVGENLRLGHFRRRDGARARDTARMLDYFPVLRERLREPAGGLSGGQQQMLAIARALLSRPRLLLLDEPSLGLAPVVTQELFRIVARINQEERTTVIVVEQNAELALAIAQHAHVLEAGRIVLSGTADRIRADDAVARSYLGYEV
ncbi:ABC transporter ATP-binding protein [Nocardia thailandica]|uniref:ABC transporter ATP-binding protein n=1 Tax=Nocardia thailandica TaxID=257275 RepID=UPI00030641EF|nr:ABC transporter ATP-binding protein [Nocardia thailandica]